MCGLFSHSNEDICNLKITLSCPLPVTKREKYEANKKAPCPTVIKIYWLRLLVDIKLTERDKLEIINTNLFWGLGNAFLNFNHISLQLKRNDSSNTKSYL